MCLILLAWRAHPDYALLVAANRDEFHDRPSASAGFWPDRTSILAGRDLQEMGTWLGVTRKGKFAAVTNYRDPRDTTQTGLSRGQLASRYLEGRDGAAAYMAGIQAERESYRGYNLLAADRAELWWSSNRGNGAKRLESGIYGLSNHLLDTGWPKVERGKEGLRETLRGALAFESLFELLARTDIAEDADLPDTGVGLQRERVLSPLRIVSSSYGTRCSTVVMMGYDGRVRFAERSFAADGRAQDTVRYEFSLDNSL